MLLEHSPPDHISQADAVARARAAGVVATWTGDYRATVDLSRLAGPHDGIVPIPDGRHLHLPGRGPWSLTTCPVRALLYHRVLTRGTQFDIYRWVNLIDLADVWHELDLPDGVRSDWLLVLRAAGLLEPGRPWAGPRD